MQKFEALFTLIYENERKEKSRQDKHSADWQNCMIREDSHNINIILLS